MSLILKTKASFPQLRSISVKTPSNVIILLLRQNFMFPVIFRCLIWAGAILRTRQVLGI